MKKFLLFFTLICLVIPSSVAPNLLLNPSFERPFVCPSAATCVADKWKAWSVDLPYCKPYAPGCDIPCPSNCMLRPGRCSTDTGCYWARGEWAETDLSNRVLDLKTAQKYFVYGRMGQGGVYQQLKNISVGQLYLFKVNLEAWQCFNYNKCSGGYHSDEPANMNLKVGIDPYGGINPASSQIVWSATGESFDTYTEFSVIAQAMSTTITVYVFTAPRFDFARANNDAYMDKATTELFQSVQRTYFPFFSLP